MIKLKKVIFTCFLFGSALSARAQITSFYGVGGGLSIYFGTHSNRIGVNLKAYYTYGFVQVNAQVSTFYNWRMMGNGLKSPELHLGVGAEFGFGRKDSVRNEFIGLNENNLEQIYSAGYSFLHYFDKAGTGQSTGIIGMNIGSFRMMTENDLFGAGQGWRDRFRTGAFLLEYTYENIRFGTSCILWTGDYSRSTWIKESEYPGRWGYLSADKAILGDKSAGILALQATYLFPFQQEARLAIGIDNEHIRDVFQNKFIHDQPFFRAEWVKRKPPHIPMLDTQYNQFIYQEGQEVRPGKFFFQLAGNPTLFY